MGVGGCCFRVGGLWSWLLLVWCLVWLVVGEFGYWL